MMNRKSFFLTGAILAILATGCTVLEDNSMPKPVEDSAPKKIDFDITVTRDGKTLSSGPGTKTKAEVNTSDMLATMDPDKPFGLIGIDSETNTLLLDNQQVFNNGSSYSGWFGGDLWKAQSNVTLSAYYPYVTKVSYEKDNTGYSIPFSTDETEAGPLVSKTMQRAVDQLNMIPLEFQHITNDIGYKVCDVTPTDVLQGLIHLRKMTVYNVASAGTFVNDLNAPRGFWHHVGYYRDVVVFEGDAKVGVGSANEKFVGTETLVDEMSASSRYYSIPDEIKLGKQYVEVIYDVDGFTLNGFPYPPLKNQVAKYALYGLLPGNVFANGKQYTFHIGLDLSSVYQEITFTASVSDWETKIYEDNEDF